MKNYLNFIFILPVIFTGFISLSGYCQGWGNNQINELIPEIHESVVLQTDRSVYAAGEEIWFSATCYINGKKPEIVLSRVLYLELYNQLNESIFKGKFDVSETGSRGSFLIPDETRSGVYLLRAYTAFMRNFAVEDFFTTSLTIVNPQFPPDFYHDSGKDIEIAVENTGFENGNLYRGAIKLSPEIMKNASGMKITGTGVGEDVSIDPASCGVAGFTLKTSDTTKPFVVVALKNGDTLVRQIPLKSKPSFSFSATWAEGNLIYQMPARPPLESQLQLQVFSAGFRLMATLKPESARNKTTFTVAGNQLSTGLNYLVLINEREQILKVSVIYKFQPVTHDFVLKTDKTTYASREKVEVDVDLQDSFENTERQAVMVVVAKKGTAGFFQHELISPALIENPMLLSGFLLQGKFGGKPDDELIQAICQLQSAATDTGIFHKNMRKYENPTLEFLPEIRGITISGKVLDKNSHQPAIDLPVYSSVLFGNPQVNIFNTVNEGRFVIPLHEIAGEQDVFLCPSPYSTANSEIMVNQDFTAIYPEIATIAFPFDSTSKDFLKELVFNARVNSAYKVQDFSVEKKVKRALLYFGNEKTVIRPDDYISLKNMKEVFTEIIPVVKVRKSGNRHKLVVTDDHANFLPGSPLLLVDNMPVFDADQVLQIHPSQVDRIEVINKVYVLGDHPINGIIMIFTKTDNFGGIERPAQSVFAEFQTLEKTTSFSSPAYISEKEIKSPMPDFRNVLYWNPQQTLTKSNPSFSFFTPDCKGDYEIIIQGVDQTGKAIFGKSEFSVSR